jgi:hypothetical protein
MSVNYDSLSDVDYTPFYETNQLSAVAVIDGARYPIISASWTENAHGATDQGTVTLPLSTNPDFTIALFRGDYTFKVDKDGNQHLASPGTPGAKVLAIYPNGTTAFVPEGARLPAGSSVTSNNAPVLIEIYAGFPKTQAIGSTDINQLSRRFYGQVDLYNGVFHEDTVTFSFRSRGACLVDNHLTNVSANQTMQQFLEQQAVRYGLPKPVVNYVPGSKPATIQEILSYDQVGGANFNAALYGMRPMDLSIRGAQVDDTDVWVDAATGTIHYEAPKAVTRATVDLKYGRDWIEFDGSHAPNFSKTVQVQVHTHQPRAKFSTTIRIENDADGNVVTKQSSKFTTSDSILGTNQTIGTSSSTGANGKPINSTTLSSSYGGNFNASIGQGAGEGAKQKYVFFVGNKSPEQASAIGLAFWRQISQHEFAVKGKVPITNRLLSSLSITSLLRIHGVPWSLVNDTYYPRALEHEISVENGWTCAIAGLNHRLAGGGV